MKKSTKHERKENIKDVIQRLLIELKNEEIGTERYEMLLDHLEMAYKIEKEAKSKNISPDTILIVAGNLVGIICILGFEQAHVVASKALNFVLRGRV